LILTNLRFGAEKSSRQARGLPLKLRITPALIANLMHGGWSHGQSDPRAGSRSSSHPIRDF
jgi:hypothetical protein